MFYKSLNVRTNDLMPQASLSSPFYLVITTGLMFLSQILISFPSN